MGRSTSRFSRSETGIGLLATVIGVAAMIEITASRLPMVTVMTVLGGAVVVGVGLWVLGHRVRSGKMTKTKAQIVVVATAIGVVATAFILGELLGR